MLGRTGNCLDWEFDTSVDYDTGTVTITIAVPGGSSATYTTSYGSVDTPSSVATSLAGKVNADPARLVNASPSSGTINFFAVNAGLTGNNITVSVSSLTNNPAEFGSGTTSFPATRATPTLTGGENAIDQAHAVLSATRHLSTTYGYDIFDHLLSVSQGAMDPVGSQTFPGQPRSFSYDHLGRLVSSTTPESGTVTNYYTKDDGTSCSQDISLVCRTVDARNITRSFTYDGLNRLTGVSYANDPTPGGTPSVTYQYDVGANALDRLTKITEGANPPTLTQTFTYDNRGRIVTANQVIDGNPYNLSYAYNAADQVTSITYPTNRVVLQNVDDLGRLQSIASAGTTYVTVNAWNAAMQPAQLTYGNQVQGAFHFNDHLQIDTLRYSKSGGADLLNLSYDYTTGVSGNNGQIQAVRYYTAPGAEDPTRSEYFTYDNWSRLNAAHTGTVSSTPGTWSLTWGYDRLGNRLSQTLNGGNVSIGQPTFTVDQGTNRITSTGYNYDLAGNMTHDATTAYSYDGANRLIAANNGSTPAAYTYFGALRIKKVVGTTTTLTVYSGTQPIVEYLNGSVNKEYLYSGSTLLATISAGAATYHYPDHLSNRVEANSSGIPVRTYGHFPFGETWYETGTADKWKFTSYGRDTGESNLDYANARDYGSLLARFSTPDPLAGSLSNPQTLNRYAYVANDPVNVVDPTGLAGFNAQSINCLDSESGNCIARGGPSAGAWGDCTADFIITDCHVVSNLINAGVGVQCPYNNCGIVIQELRRPTGPDWVAPGAGDPELVSAGCVVNISHTSGLYGDRVWCPGWGAMVLRWGGDTQWQITNIGLDSLAYRHDAWVAPTMSPSPTPAPMTKGNASALCLLAATKSSNGIGASTVLNPGHTVDAGTGVYADAPRSPKLGDEAIAAGRANAMGAALSQNTTFWGIYGSCVNSLGYFPY